MHRFWKGRPVCLPSTEEPLLEAQTMAINRLRNILWPWDTSKGAQLFCVPFCFFCFRFRNVQRCLSLFSPLGKASSGSRQNNQLVGERRNSEKTLNDVAFVPIGMRASTNGLGLENWVRFEHYGYHLWISVPGHCAPLEGPLGPGSPEKVGSK